MYIVKPITSEKLWGDSRLHAYQGDKNVDKIGILFTVSGIDGIDCEIENEQEKTTLKKLTNTNPEVLGLKKGEEYPVIIEFDSCQESVSFQMHPTDTYAKEQLGLLYGKSEAWYFIEEPTDKWVYAENITGQNEAVKKALETNDFNGVIGKYPTQKDDLIYIRSGTIHALTKGSLIYEIQQSTNLTYRLYDYDRIDKDGNKRPLHIQEALDNLDSSLKIQCNPFKTNTIFHEREFSLDHTIIQSSFTNTNDVACAISVVSNEITVNSYCIKQGMSILVLPDETIQIQGSADCIVAYPHSYWRKK